VVNTRKKNIFLSLINELDLKAESTPLDDDERAKLRKANDDITKLRRYDMRSQNGHREPK
jgi:hypothetical protein